MGREARGVVVVDGERMPVTLHLDGTALDVRGSIRRHVPRERIGSAVADGTILTVTAGEETLVIELGAPAAPWAKALLAVPPTLAEKLGLTPGRRAFCIGTPPSEIVAAVGRAAPDAAAADLVVATVATDAVLAGLVALLHGVTVPVWVVHGKGTSPAPGAAHVREVMRAAGYRDTKVTAVSDAWSATRYHP